MGHGHSHLHPSLSSSEITTQRAKWILIGILTALFVATMIGIWRMWPSESALNHLREQSGFDAPSVTYEKATIETISPTCPSQGITSGQQGSISSIQFTCQSVEITIESGEDAGTRQQINVVGPPAKAGLQVGDHITVMRNPIAHQASNPQSPSVIYSLSGIDRGPLVLAMLATFVITVIAVARWKGLRALIGLGLSLAVLVYWMLPALATGESATVVGIVASMAIMFVVIYIAHGFHLWSSAALMGTFVGLAISTGLGALAVFFGRLSGYISEEEMGLAARVPDLDFRQLLIAAMIVAGLGVLNDVTITQASAVWELRAAGPHLSRRKIFTSAMRIGRDHIASTIYTIIFAYAGAALSTLLLLLLFYDRPVWDLLGTEQFGGEVLRTIASATGLVLSVPITTAISAILVKKAEPAIASQAEETASATALKRVKIDDDRSFATDEPRLW